MKLEICGFRISQGNITATMRWPERSWPEMEPISHATITVECGISSASEVDMNKVLDSVLWRQQIAAENLDARNAFITPLAFGVERLYVSVGNSLIAYDLAHNRDFIFWTANNKWASSILTRDDKVIVLAKDLHKTAGEIVMLASTGEVLWRTRPAPVMGDGFIEMRWHGSELVATTWGSQSTVLDLQTGQIIQSSFTR